MLQDDYLRDSGQLFSIGHHLSDQQQYNGVMRGGASDGSNIFSMILESWLNGLMSYYRSSSLSPSSVLMNNNNWGVDNNIGGFYENYAYRENDSSSIEFPVNVFNLTTAPMSIADITFFSIGIAICIVNIFLGFAVLLNQRFRVVKTKQPKLMAVSVILGSISFISYAYTNNMITNHPDLCALINIWVVLFSLLGWMSCIIVRLITVFVLFNIMVKYNIKRKIPTAVWFLICLIPCLIACVIATALDLNNYNTESCEFEVPGFILFVVLVVVYVAAMLIMSILTHNVRRAYKESKIEVIMLVLIIFTTCFIAICFSVRLNLLIPIRIIISYVPLFLSSTYFYAVMHRVVWYTLRSWMGCNRWRRDLSFFEDWDMRFFVDSNNTIFTNEQIRRVMNLENKALNHQQLLDRDDDLTNFSNAFNDSTNVNIEIGNYIPPSVNDSLQTSSLDSSTSSQQLITDKKFFGLSPTPSPTNKKHLIHSSSKRNLFRVLGSNSTKSFVDGDQIVTEQDIINQALVHNINMGLEDYSPPRYYIGKESEKRR